MCCPAICCKMSRCGVQCLAPLLLVAIVASSLSVAESVVIVVGGATGWTTGFDYDAWATQQNLQPRVGDALLFMNKDPLTHTVAMVADADSYQRCTLGGATNITPIAPGTNYTLTIPASLSGLTIYAVCTIAGHCSEGQKITGTVLPALSAATPSPSPPSPPSSTTPAPAGNDADTNRIFCWTTAILLVAACFWNLG